MRIHIVCACAAVILGFVFRIDAASWAAVILCIALVIAAECINTSIELLVDAVSPGYSEFAKHAKDCAAGAVLACAMGSLGVAFVVFGSRVLALLA